MKKMKKLFAVILSLAMVLGMSLTTLAANERADGTITINLPTGMTETEQNAVKISYVQIVAADRESKDDWKFVNGYDATKLGMSIDELKTAGSTETGNDKTNDNKNAENGKINQTNKLGAALEKVSMTEGSDGLKDVTGSGATRTINNVGAGLYVIKAELSGWTFTRMLAYVAYTDTVDASGNLTIKPTTVTAKGAKDQVVKELADPRNDDDTVEIVGGDKGESAARGDEVKYRVTQSYPYYDADQSPKRFTIIDKLAQGTFKNPIGLKVTIVSGNNDGSDKILDPKDYTLTEDLDKKGFTLELGTLGTYNHYNAAYAGKQVHIEYSVIVDQDAGFDAALINNVTSILTGGEPDEPDKETRSRIITPSVKADIKKIGENGENDVLQGATFTAYVKVDDDTWNNLLANDKYVYRADTKKIDNKSDAPGTNDIKLKKVTDVITTNEGIATFDGLDAQKVYYVAETNAPEGYSLNETVYKLVMPNVTKTGPEEVAADEDDEDQTPWMETKYIVDKDTPVTFEGEPNSTVKDTKLSSLPSTGGIGTTIFTIGGCAIMVIAAGLFFASRRKSTDAK